MAMSILLYCVTVILLHCYCYYFDKDYDLFLLLIIEYVLLMCLRLHLVYQTIFGFTPTSNAPSFQALIPLTAVGARTYANYAPNNMSCYSFLAHTCLHVTTFVFSWFYNATSSRFGKIKRHLFFTFIEAISS